MAWRNATRDLTDGTQERRCSRRSHSGARWLPLNADHFYPSGSGYSHWCRVCQSAAALERWHRLHPPKRELERRAAAKRRAVRLLDAVTSGWGR